MGGVCVLFALVLPATASAAFGPAGGWGGPGKADGQFSHPQSVAVDSSGRVYVADTGNGRVERFKADGTFLNSYSPSPASAAFSPEDVALGPGGSIYVASPTRIDLWSSLGVHLTSWTPPGAAYGIAVDPSTGNVYVSDTTDSKIHEYSGLGTDMGSFGSQGSGPGQLLHPQGLTTDASGNVYVADPENARVEEFSSSGGFLGQVAMPAYTVNVGGSSFPGNLYPHDVAVDAGDRIFAPDAGVHSNLLGVFSSGGALQQLFGRPDSDPTDPCILDAPWGVATSGSGTLYVVSTGEDRVRAFDENSTCPAPSFGIPGGTGTGAGTGSGGGGGAGAAAGAVSDRSRPKVKFTGFPRGCARRNFSFVIHATDDVQLARLVLYVNHNKAASQAINKAEWTVRVNMPVRKVRRQIPRGVSIRVLIQVKVTDASGKRSTASRAFRICG